MRSALLRSANVVRLPTRPQKTLRESVEEMIAEQAEQLMLKRFEADLVKHVREINYVDLLNEEMDDIESYHQIECLKRLADKRQKDGEAAAEIDSTRKEPATARRGGDR